MNEEIDYNSRENKIAVFTAWLDGKPWQSRLSAHRALPWIDRDDTSPPCFDIDILYRVKPTPKRVPLEAKDVPPGSAVKPPGAGDHWSIVTLVDQIYVAFRCTTNSYQKTFNMLMEEGWKIKRPGQEWEDCSKVEESK